jgi:hypothetical protein
MIYSVHRLLQWIERASSFFIHGFTMGRLFDGEVLLIIDCRIYEPVAL